MFIYIKDADKDEFVVDPAKVSYLTYDSNDELTHVFFGSGGEDCLSIRLPIKRVMNILNGALENEKENNGLIM